MISYYFSNFQKQLSCMKKVSTMTKQHLFTSAVRIGKTAKICLRRCGNACVSVITPLVSSLLLTPLHLLPLSRPFLHLLFLDEFLLTVLFPKNSAFIPLV